MIKNSKCRIEQILINSIIVAIAIFAIAPIWILQKNYIFTIHDNLDSFPGFVEMLRENNLFFSIKTQAPVMNGISTSFIGMSYNLYGFLNGVFGYIWGAILSRTISVIAGYFSMKLLLLEITKNRKNEKLQLLKMAAMLYAVIPSSPYREISFAVMPLFVWFFIYFYNKTKFDKKIFLVLAIPLTIQFMSLGIFLYGLWLLFFVIAWIKQKKPNVNLIFGLVLMSLGSVLADIQFFIMKFGEIESNRSLIVNTESGNAFGQFKELFLNGQYHAPSFHRYIILPICVIGLLVIAIKLFAFKKDTNQKLLFKICVFLFSVLVVINIIAALSDTGYLNLLIAKILPVLEGFNFGRVMHLSHFLWYVLFALVLFCLAKNIFTRILAYVLILMQLVLVVCTPVYYNDMHYNTFRFINKERSVQNLTFNEFFDENLFNKIKKDINYENEYVAAFGFQPSVLMYNGFKTLDGYASVHSMQWQNDFRKIIAPELEANEYYKSYYDHWGGRMYLYSSEVTFMPELKVADKQAICRIDVNAFKEFGGKYIISRVYILNAQEIGLQFVNSYINQSYLYDIWVYEAA